MRRTRRVVVVAVLASLLVLALVAPAAAHPPGSGPPPTAELSADGRAVTLVWRAQDDDVADLLEHLDLVPEGTSEQYRWWAVGDPLPEDERLEASADPVLVEYVHERVALDQDGVGCERTVEPARDVLDGGIEVRFACPEPVDRVELEIVLLHDVDPGYRTVAFAGEAGEGDFAAFTSDVPRHVMTLDGGSDPLGALTAWPGLTESAQARVDALADVEPTVPALAVGILLALAVGAGHGLAPGHAKAATAAYLSGGRGRRRDALAVGALVAVAHTGTVLALGAILHLVPWNPARSAAIGPALAVVAGCVIVVVGVTMLRRPGHHHHHGGHGHVPRRRELAAVGLAGGLLPSPTALVLLGTTWLAGRVEVGLLLVAAFGVGLAASVAAIATLALAGRDALVRRSTDSQLAHRIATAVPVLGATVVVGSGTLLAVVGLLGLT
ncbi:hypothetical protein ER308_09750 [Egibacter rhizosphaerae]|uniref:Nickel/cobalt efflux system n=1 Tax=Egibacter rhizosphaerae TaxID=1670831 RepID=A0A411YFB8_9ACTN|nr:hypothetical protein [Egibacter rhizosphaerae]QBI19812.1 hypothetical protein ER308_09750 [Egibacter rhizosphaerae]